jgi:hypothetical protein
VLLSSQRLPEPHKTQAKQQCHQHDQHRQQNHILAARISINQLVIFLIFHIFMNYFCRPQTLQSTFLTAGKLKILQNRHQIATGIWHGKPQFTKEPMTITELNPTRPAKAATVHEALAIIHEQIINRQYRVKLPETQDTAHPQASPLKQGEPLTYALIARQMPCVTSRQKKLRTTLSHIACDPGTSTTSSTAEALLIGMRGLKGKVFLEPDGVETLPESFFVTLENAVKALREKEKALPFKRLIEKLLFKYDIAPKDFYTRLAAKLQVGVNTVTSRYSEENYQAGYKDNIVDVFRDILDEQIERKAKKSETISLGEIAQLEMLKDPFKSPIEAPDNTAGWTALAEKRPQSSTRITYR